MNHFITRGLLASTLLFAANAAQAQITIGARVGANLANARITTNSSFVVDTDTKAKVGAQAGLTLNAQFGKLAVQPSVLFSQKGFQLTQAGTATLNGVTTTFLNKSDAALNYLEVPVNLVYTFGDEQGFQIFAGPYVGVGLSGKDKRDGRSIVTMQSGAVTDYSTSETYDVRFGDGRKENSIYYRTINVGLNGGIGYRVGALQAQVGYVYGLSNMLPSYYGDTVTGKDRTVQLSLVYFFGTHK
ncbi:porin family protein [Hymenobacter sp. YC55]|uniref:porin family protein n=1 Tax=Hymenobacter sp. YC55 TaxID=3034019 RepID=UPI0023F98A48|nr:porin family protein [Hymenobacter sp. YC55]MDF7813320.1 porin family protein [Hymenobacter sp. YC55]